jgi:hypothetical protein
MLPAAPLVPAAPELPASPTPPAPVVPAVPVMSEAPGVHPASRAATNAPASEVRELFMFEGNSQPERA